MALMFTAVNDSFFCSTPASSYTGTFCWWGTTTTTAQVGCFVALHNNSFGNEIRVRFNGTTTQLEINTSAATNAIVTMTLNAWYFFAVSFDGPKHVVYWSQAGGGGPLNSISFNDPVAGGTSFDVLTIGDDNGGGGSAALAGKIEAFKYWDNVVLTAAELQNEMPSFTPNRRTSLRRWYPFLNLATATRDMSGQGNTLSTNASNPSDTPGAPASWLF